MKMFRVVVLGLLMVGPVVAQEMPHLNLMADGPGKTDEQKAADSEREKAYRDSLKKIPDAKPSSNDPWGGMRSASSAKSSPAKPSKSSSAKKPTKGAVN